MPVPVWDSDIMPEGESLATDTTVSDDIWKKFDLDLPLDHYQHRYQNELHDEVCQASSLPVHYEVPMMMHFDKLNCQASREIRHHDCMWAGLCISKEHNRTHPAKKDNPVHRRIPAGRSLLIPKNQNLQQQQSQPQHCSSSSSSGNSNLQSHSLTSSNVHSHNSSMAATNTSTSSNGYHQSNCRTTTKNLESDGDSTRPETPQSSEEETESEEEEDEAPVFRHEQINIDDLVSMPVSSPGEVTNQSLRPLADRRKAEQLIAQEKSTKETVIRNTLMSDHCYHLNQQPIKLEHLGVQTPSDSGEFILYSLVSTLTNYIEINCVRRRVYFGIQREQIPVSIKSFV